MDPEGQAAEVLGLKRQGLAQVVANASMSCKAGCRIFGFKVQDRSGEFGNVGF